MSLGLTKPGASVALRHPKTGAVLVPLGYTKLGKAIMPVLGASSDDPDDPDFIGGGEPTGGSDDDGDEEHDEEEDEKASKRSTKSKKDEDDDEDDEDDKKSSRPERQAARYRIRAREEKERADALAERLRKLEDSDKPQDEILKRDLDETKQKYTALETRTRTLSLENAFLRANDVQWNDPEDALKLLDFDEIDVDEDGTVDARQLRRALRDLAKRKPHLVKKSKSQDEDSDDDEPSSRSGSTMNSTRRGARKQETDRQSLSRRFPVLGR